MIGSTIFKNLPNQYETHKTRFQIILTSKRKNFYIQFTNENSLLAYIHMTLSPPNKNTRNLVLPDITWFLPY